MQKIQSHLTREQWLANNGEDEIWQWLANKEADKLRSNRAATLAGTRASIVQDWVDACVTKVLQRHIQVVIALQEDARFLEHKQERKQCREARVTKKTLFDRALKPGPGPLDGDNHVWKRSRQGIECANCAVKLTLQHPKRRIQHLLASPCLARNFEMYRSAWGIHASHDVRLINWASVAVFAVSQAGPSWPWRTLGHLLPLSGSELRSSTCDRKKLVMVLMRDGDELRWCLLMYTSKEMISSTVRKLPPVGSFRLA